MDCIWHNVWSGSPKSFITMRRWSNEDMGAIVSRVARHVQMGYYTLISLQLSKHSLVVVCSCTKPLEEWMPVAF